MSSAPSKKHVSKRKAALAALEDPSADEEKGMTIEQIDEDDEAEMEAAARKAERKKAKHHEAPKLDIVSVPPPQRAAKTKAEQIRELQESMTDEEKQELAQPPVSKALVPAAAAAASSSTAVVPKNDKFTKLNPYIDTMLENEGGLSALEAFKLAYETCKPLVKSGAVRVKNPDLAIALWCYAANMRVSFMDLNDIMEHKPQLIQVKRTYEKKREVSKNEKTGKDVVKYVDDKSKPHINLRLKGEQYFMPDHVHNIYGLTFLTPFCSTAFFRHGPTYETGVDGTNGKVIRGKVTPPENAQYQITLQNQPITPLVVDDNFNNPIADYFFGIWQRLGDTVVAKSMEDGENMAEIRAMAARQLKSGTISAIPATGEEWVAWMKKFEKFKSLYRTDDSDDSAKGLQCSASVFRKPFETKEEGKVVWSEFEKDVGLTEEEKEAKHHPTELFKDQKFNKKTKQLQIHNDIPTFRGRRHDELEEGKSYPAPLIYVGKSHAVITRRHRVAVLSSMGVYEWQFDTPGLTNKPLAYIVLGRDDQLKRLTIDDIVAVDPRYAVPMAQPFGEDDTAEQQQQQQGSVDAEGNWSAMPADPDHAGFGSSSESK